MDDKTIFIGMRESQWDRLMGLLEDEADENNKYPGYQKELLGFRSKIMEGCEKARGERGPN